MKNLILTFVCIIMSLSIFAQYDTIIQPNYSNHAFTVPDLPDDASYIISIQNGANIWIKLTNYEGGQIFWNGPSCTSGSDSIYSCGAGTYTISYQKKVGGFTSMHIYLRYFYNVIDSTQGSPTFGQTPDTVYTDIVSGTARLSVGPNFVASWWNEISGSGVQWASTDYSFDVPHGTYAVMTKDKGFYFSYDTIVVLDHPTTCTPSNQTNTVNICQGQSVTVGTHTYSNTGTYTDNLQTKKGCDSTIITKLTVNQTYNITTNISICQGDSIMIGSTWHKTPGTFYSTLSTKLGCDSIVNTKLTVNPIYNLTQNLTICEGDSILFSGTYIKSTVPHIFHLISKTGCDSTITVNLTIKPKPTVWLGPNEQSYCGNIILNAESANCTYLWQDGSTNPTYLVTTTGTYYVVASNSCGTILDTVHVTIGSSQSIYQNIQICHDDIITVNGHAYSSTGLYRDTIKTAGGCDSIIITDLFVGQKYNMTQNLTICNGDSIVIGLHKHKQSGNFTDTLKTTIGCDSIVQTHLTVNPTYNISQTKTLCQGESITVGTHTYSQSGTFTDNLKTKLGCDSIVQTQVIVSTTYNISQTKTLCQGESITVGTHTYSQSGTFTDNLKTKLGCDSIIQTHITVTALPAVSLGVDTVYAILGTTITLDAGIGFIYKWSTKETSQTITVVKPDNYSVTVSNSCGTATDSMLLITTMTNIRSVNDDNTTVFPNPTSTYFNIKSNGSAIVELYSVNGILVLQKKIEANEKIAVNKLSKGSYIVKIITNNNVVTKTLIVD